MQRTVLSVLSVPLKRLTSDIHFELTVEFAIEFMVGTS